MNIPNSSVPDPNFAGGRGPTDTDETSGPTGNDDVRNSNGNASNDEAQRGGGVGRLGGAGAEGDGRPSSYIMEGYTPLNINMNTFAMMNSSDSEGDIRSDDGRNNANLDEEMDDEMNGDVFAAGYYHVMGAPPRRLNGIKDLVMGYSMPQDDEEHSASSHLNDSDNGHSRNGSNEDASPPPVSVGVPDDFQLLAEQALRGLEVDHSSTLERSTDIGANVITGTLGGNTISPNHATDFDACFPSFDEKHHDNTNMQASDEQVTSRQTNSDDLDATTTPDKAEPPTPNTDPVIMPKTRTKEQLKTSKSKPMDVNAVQKAMQSIRLKSPKLATSLDAGASSSFSTTEAHAATDAAMAHILNSTSQKIEQSRNQKQHASHAIIPAGPLAAFRRTTPKAQTASANLTRSATLSEAILRLWPLICFRRRMRAMGLGTEQRTNHHSKILTIHILGADGVECSSEESVRKSVGPFVRWVDAALQSGSLGQAQDRLNKTATLGMPAQSQATDIDTLLIEFSGPNMPISMIGKVLELATQSNSQSAVGLASAKVIFQQREYHEASSSLDDDDTPPADIAIAFNAGIWGYDSWNPTIASMCQPAQFSPPKSVDAKGNGRAADYNSGIGRSLFVITGYTVEECEDDAEVVSEVVQKVAAEISQSTKSDLGSIARQLWAPETNPFSSRSERKTASAPSGRKYYENGAWQAWLLGL